MIPGAHELVVDAATLSGEDVEGLTVQVEQVIPRPIHPVAGQVLIPSTLSKPTNAAGEATFRLLPSAIAGYYLVRIGEYRREITMPERVGSAHQGSRRHGMTAKLQAALARYWRAREARELREFWRGHDAFMERIRRSAATRMANREVVTDGTSTQD